MSLPTCLDYSVTTPVAPKMAEAMQSDLWAHFGNPSSSHAYGQRARQGGAMRPAHIADLIGANAGEIVFTGCDTDANNLAVLVVAHALKAMRRHLITCAIEHPAVIQAMLQLREDGWDVPIVSVDEYGLVDV